MRIFTVRHGQTNYNIKHLCNDDPQINVYLTDEGKKQARIVAEKLKNIKFDLIFISEIPRTRETAGFINKHHDLELKVDIRINDRKTGFEGGTTHEFNEIMKDDLFNKKLEGGESFQEEKARVFSFLEELCNFNCENILIVSHHEIIKIITGYFNKLNNQEIWDLKITNCMVGEFCVKKIR